MTIITTPITIRTAILTVMMLLIFACAAPPQRIAEHHYGLTLDLSPLDLSGEQTITLDRVHGQGIFASRPLIKKIGQSPAQYIETRSKLWHSAPADLLQDAVLKGWNDASGRVVATSSTLERPQLKLDLHLTAIGFDQRGAGFITIRAVLSTDKRKALINRHYQAVGPAASNLNQSVLSIETAAVEVFNALGMDIATAIQ
jgi:uncharacterized lipoprotein YmbA